MSISKYKFVSPGVFIREIDRSRLPVPSEVRGPVIIGRTERGPSMRPVKVTSFSDYIEMFGDTVPGGTGGDAWRNGNYSSPMFATYAAEAWLRNGQTATIVRLLGAQHPNLTAGSGEAGWGSYSRASHRGGGAYGLFLIDSGSANDAGSRALRTEPGETGSLAAVWYFPNETHSIMLSGTLRGADTVLSGAATMISPTTGRDEYTAVILNDSTEEEKFSFNFDPNSSKFIRKVFNTNPIMTNGTLIPGASSTTGSLRKYWLGHSFEGPATTKATDTTEQAPSSSATYGIILGLGNTTSGIVDDWSAFKKDSAAAKSGWVISQDLRGSTYTSFDSKTTNQVEKLFQFHSLDLGEWANRSIKVSIINISASPNEDVDPYGTFDVIVRRSHDSDNRVEILEQYNNCNLNPSSPNYLARKVGDVYTQWDGVERRFRLYGDYPNVSKFIRVEMNLDAVDSRYLPFGFWGPYRPMAFTIGHKEIGSSWHTQTGSIVGNATFATTASIASPPTGGMDLNLGAATFATSSLEYPRIRMRISSSDASLPNDRAAYFGYDTNRQGTYQFDPSNIDLLRMLPSNLTPDASGSIEISTAFTLDDLVISERDSSGEKGKAAYTSGSRAAGTSATALTGTYTSIIDNHGFNKFTFPMYGGSDGWDITEMDPVANRILSGKNERTSYAFNTVRRAIDACSDPERVDFNLMVAPGITNTTLTDLMANVCEDRGDALAIVDLPDVYRGPAESSNTPGEFASFANRLGSLDSVVTNFKQRKKNTSYACTYYPWIQVRDSLSDASVWAPPSVVALGTFAHSDAVGELWFAPAGFNRGGLSQGSSGLTVTNISERLTSGQRDKLYEANINPIASFPNEGLVIFGQKTLDASTSALSRINVRRLLIFLKKEVSRLANQVLFDQNVPATWARFKGLVIPLLDSVKIRFGLTDYKLVLDETTTTPDLVDRNVLYAKIFLKPARAIEFIALDFIITRTGAAFED